MRKLTIYTDGSHFKGSSNRLGIGGVIIDENNNLLDSFSEEITPEYAKINLGTSDVSNPTMEMLAALYAIKEFSKIIKNNDEVVLKADYLGVKCWNKGEWKIKEPYIRKIKDEIDFEIKRQHLFNRLDFQWVKGHQSIMDKDSYWNNEVDKLAKGL